MNASALVLVDLQNDFMPGGALAVPRGDETVPVANAAMERFGTVLATQDWHPPGHASFAANHPGRRPGEIIELNGLEQVLWPVHCVQNTPGAEFHPELETGRIDQVFRKGMDPGVDSYSGFFDNAQEHATGLAEYCRARGIGKLAILGLATDYCVKFTALDGVRLGFDVTVLLDGCRGVELAPGDVARAIEQMRAADVKLGGSA